jgi:hypothetical protein
MKVEEQNFFLNKTSSKKIQIKKKSLLTTVCRAGVVGCGHSITVSSQNFATSEFEAFKKI